MRSLTSLRAHTVSRAFRVATLLTLAVAAAGCTRSETADAKGRDVAAKPVATAAVLKKSVRRSVDVVGTLAAVDQVTISSGADGTVRAIVADLGDRVKAGQVLIQLDNEKQQYTYEQQQAALARALAQYGARLTLLLVPVAYVKFDALERAVVGDAAKAWLGRVSAATVGRLRAALDRP